MHILGKHLLRKVISICLLGLCKIDDKIRDFTEKESLGTILNNLIKPPIHIRRGGFDHWNNCCGDVDIWGALSFVP